MPEALKEDTSPLLRPHQKEEMLEEKTRIERTLGAPAHIASQIQDRGALTRQLRKLDHQLATQTPKAYEGKKKDAAAARESELRDAICAGMPTQEEMRKNPPGAVDKHRLWESRNKANLLEWKNIRLRLHASGDSGSLRDDRDVANFERYRPVGGAQQLNMAGAQISGKDYHFPPGQIPARNVMSEEDRAAHKAEMATLQAEIDSMRAEIKGIGAKAKANAQKAASGGME